DPLYTFLTLSSDGTVEIRGKKSVWNEPTPRDRGYPEYESLSSSIIGRRLRRGERGEGGESLPGRQPVQGTIDAGEYPLAAQKGERIEHAKADSFSGDRDAEGVNDLPHANSLLLDKAVERRIERRNIPRRDPGKFLSIEAEEFGRFGWLAETFFEGLLVVRELVVGDEEVVVVEYVS